MTPRPTIQLGDPVLRRVAAPVRWPAGETLLRLEQDLADTLIDWRSRTTYGRGIAAPQIGVSHRVVYLDFDGPMLLVNPRIVAHSDAEWEPWDTCLSFSVDFFCRVRRWEWVQVCFEDAGGRRHEIRADGELSELLQHEIDHLDGLLATDRMTAAPTLCMRSEFEAPIGTRVPIGPDHVAGTTQTATTQEPTLEEPRHDPLDSRDGPDPTGAGE